MATDRGPSRAHVGTRGMPRLEREAGILDAAAAEFGARGYHAGTVDAVASRAGISKPLVHAYFGTKDALYARCVERLTDVLMEAMTPVVANAEPGMAMAVETMQTIFTTLEGRAEDWRVLHDATVPPGSEAHAAVETCRARIVELGAVGVRSALAAHAGATDDPLDPEMMNHVWQAVVTSMVGFWFEHPDQTPDQLTARFGRVLAALVEG